MGCFFLWIAIKLKMLRVEALPLHSRKMAMVCLGHTLGANVYGLWGFIAATTPLPQRKALGSRQRFVLSRCVVRLTVGAGFELGRVLTFVPTV